MKLVRHAPRSFLATAGPFLERAEAEHILMLGIARSLMEGDITLSAPPVLLTVDDDAVQLAALRTPPHNLLVSRGPSAAVQALCRGLRELGTGLPGVTGPADAAAELAACWTDRRELTMSQRVYRCDAVVEPADPGGRVRTAAPHEVDTLVRWTRMFNEEARNPGSDAGAQGMVRDLVDREQLFVWEHDGELVSMAAARQPSPHGIRIGYVYTPPDHRRRGFASAVTAGATKAMLEQGYAFCCLYTDLANPTSNAIYQRIGYRAIGDSGMWRFLPESN